MRLAVIHLEASKYWAAPPTRDHDGVASIPAGAQAKSSSRPAHVPSVSATKPSLIHGSGTVGPAASVDGGAALDIRAEQHSQRRPIHQLTSQSVTAAAFYSAHLSEWSRCHSGAAVPPKIERGH